MATTMMYDGEEEEEGKWQRIRQTKERIQTKRTEKTERSSKSKKGHSWQCSVCSVQFGCLYVPTICDATLSAPSPLYCCFVRRALAILFYLLFLLQRQRTENHRRQDRNTKVYFSLGMFNFPETVKIRSLGQTKVALFGQAEQYRLRWSEKRIFR